MIDLQQFTDDPAQTKAVREQKEVVVRGVAKLIRY